MKIYVVYTVISNILVHRRCPSGKKIFGGSLFKTNKNYTNDLPMLNWWLLEKLLGGTIQINGQKIEM